MSDCYLSLASGESKKLSWSSMSEGDRLCYTHQGGYLSSKQVWLPARVVTFLGEGGCFPNWKISLETASRIPPYLGSRSIPADPGSTTLGIQSERK